MTFLTCARFKVDAKKIWNVPHYEPTRTPRTTRESERAQMASSGEAVCSSCGEGRVCWRGAGPMEWGGRLSGGGGSTCGGSGGPPGGKRGGNMAPGGGGAHTGGTSKKKNTHCHDWKLFSEQHDEKQIFTWSRGRTPGTPWRVELRWWRSIGAPARKRTVHGAGSGSWRQWADHPWIGFR